MHLSRVAQDTHMQEYLRHSTNMYHKTTTLMRVGWLQMVRASTTPV